MHQRCYKNYTVNYHNYGGCGVTVCKEWHDFKTFYHWAIANGWKRELFLDKDIKAKELGLPPNLYSPERCSFVTAKINSRTRKNTKLTEAMAEEIRNSKEKTSVLMERYKVGRTTIGNIRRRSSWN